MPIRQSTAAFAFAVIALAGQAAAADRNLTGSWTGGYIASDGADANTFDMNLKSSGSTFTGTATETNTFGDFKKALFLTSMIQGTIRPDGTVTFVKTYDGSGGISHSVSYSGVIDPTGRRIRGKFNAQGAEGQFEMVR